MGLPEQLTKYQLFKKNPYHRVIIQTAGTLIQITKKIINFVHVVTDKFDLETIATCSE
jgi:hypothetical protein